MPILDAPAGTPQNGTGPDFAAAFPGRIAPRRTGLPDIFGKPVACMHILLLIVMAVSLAVLVALVGYVLLRLRRHERATPPVERGPR